MADTFQSFSTKNMSKTQSAVERTVSHKQTYYTTCHNMLTTHVDSLLNGVHMHNVTFLRVHQFSFSTRIMKGKHNQDI